MNSNDLRLVRVINTATTDPPVEDAKEICSRWLSPKNKRAWTRRRNRQVYNLRMAGVPWDAIARIVRRSVSTVRVYHREGLKEAANADNPFQFMPARIRTRLSRAGINVNYSGNYERAIKAQVPGIADVSAVEIRLAADEQAAFLEDRVNDMRFAARLKNCETENIQTNEAEYSTSHPG